MIAAAVAERTCDCGGAIDKPARGPWPSRCADCRRTAEATRKRADRAAETERVCEAPGCGRRARPRSPYCSGGCHEHAVIVRAAQRREEQDAEAAHYFEFARAGEHHHLSFIPALRIAEYDAIRVMARVRKRRELAGVAP